MRGVSILLSRAAREESMRWIVVNGITGQSRTHSSAHMAMICARRWFAENELMVQKSKRVMNAATDYLDGAA